MFMWIFDIGVFQFSFFTWILLILLITEWLLRFVLPSFTFTLNLKNIINLPNMRNPQKLGGEKLKGVKSEIRQSFVFLPQDEGPSENWWQKER